MNSIVEKIIFVFLGFVISLSFIVAGCENTSTGKPGVSAKDPIDNANTTVSDSATALKGTTSTIKNETNEINKETPNSIKPKIEPHTSKILEQTTIQDGIVKQLETVKGQLDEANKRNSKLEDDFAKEQKARLAAEENVTKEFRHKIMGWSAVCFFGMLVCAGLSIFSQGNKLAIYGGVVCAVGLAVCVVLVQTIALIPWIVGGIAIIATSLFVYLQFFKDKKIKNLDTVTKELTGTIEAQKPLMPPANRQFFFGDGPVPGVVQHLQSSITQSLVNAIRNEPDFKKAPAIPPTEFIDLNSDGIDDREQNIEPIVGGDNPVVTAVSRKKRFSGVAGTRNRAKIILH